MSLKSVKKHKFNNMKANDKTKAIEIYSGTQWEAAMLQSLLENEQIEAFLMDEAMSSIAPWHSSPGGSAPVKVVVSSVDLDKALDVVKEYKKKIREEK